jgi:hypothetical protein
MGQFGVEHVVLCGLHLSRRDEARRAVSYRTDPYRSTGGGQRTVVNRAVVTVVRSASLAFRRASFCFSLLQ